MNIYPKIVDGDKQKVWCAISDGKVIEFYWLPLRFVDAWLKSKQAKDARDAERVARVN